MIEKQPHTKPLHRPNQRPLSPHLQIYRWTLTMALSILHRATGVALYGGTLLLAGWLVAVALGETPYAFAQAIITSWIGRIILFGYIWALFHHMCGGIRHFIWDMGYGFHLRHVEWLAWFSALMPLALTAGTYLLGYQLRGGF